MSGLVMGRVFYTDLPAHLKLTLLALADHAHDDGSNVKVGQARLARKIGASERAVREHVKELRAQGYIEKVGREGSHGQDRHRIVIDKLPTTEQIALMFPRPEADSRPAEVADRQPAADRDNPRPEAGRHVDRKPASAKPSENRQEEQHLASAPRPRDERWEAFLEETGVEQSELSADRRDALNGMLANLRRLTDGLTAGGIRARAREWRRRYPNAPLTPETLVRRWAELGSRKGAVHTIQSPRDGHDFAPGSMVPELCETCGEDESRHRGGSGVRSLEGQREDRDAAAELAARARIAVEEATDSTGRRGVLNG